jgi:hypothetical protein
MGVVPARPCPLRRRPGLEPAPITTAVRGLGLTAGLLNQARRDDVMPERDFAIPRRDPPEFCKKPSAPEGVGNAGCPRTRSRACSVENTRVSHHGCAGNTRHSRTQWF